MSDYKKKIKKRREQRKEYCIKPRVSFENDIKDKMVSFIPTIIFMPWRYRWNGTYVVDIWWLTFHIGIGIWDRRNENER